MSRTLHLNFSLVFPGRVLISSGQPRQSQVLRVFITRNESSSSIYAQHKILKWQTQWKYLHSNEWLRLNGVRFIVCVRDRVSFEQEHERHIGDQKEWIQHMWIAVFAVLWCIIKILKIKTFNLNLYYRSHNVTWYNLWFRCYYYTNKTNGKIINTTPVWLLSAMSACDQIRCTK